MAIPCSLLPNHRSPKPNISIAGVRQWQRGSHVPKGLRNTARGCEERAAPGQPGKQILLNEVAQQIGRENAITSSGKPIPGSSFADKARASA